MSTPEGKVKAKVKAIIAKFGDKIYSWWPVPSGYGESSLDCILCVNGHFVSIETKAEGKEPSPRQHDCIRRMKLANAYVFVIDGSGQQYRELEVFLHMLCYLDR